MADSSRIVPRKRVVSPAWDYFGLCVDDEGKVIDDGVAVYQRCNSNVRASGGNTSNLLSHLRVMTRLSLKLGVSIGYIVIPW